MQIPQKQPSMIGRSIDWIANFTYRKIPSIIKSIQKKPLPPKIFSFQDYIKQPQLARETGLMNIRQKRKDYIEPKQDIERVISQFKSSAELMKQSPHELICAICFELFSGPVTTSCNHTFCRMCIDESILFNPNCPTCRNNIRGQQLIVSKATEALIRMILYKLSIDEVERFVKQQFQYREWLQKRTPKKKELHKGQLIDVRDTENIWCKGSIIQLLPLNASDPSQYEYVLVHYEGWASRFDEVIGLSSMRLATSGFYMSRYEIPHYNLDPNNPQHYRCPVVIGPPQPIVPIVEEPIMSDSDSDNDDQIVFIAEDEDILYNHSVMEDNQDEEIIDSGIEQNQNSPQQTQSLVRFRRSSNQDHSVIFNNPQPNDNSSIEHSYENSIIPQQRLNHTLQGIQLQRNFSDENFNQKQYHNHSLPQQRILEDLIESDFGQMIYDNRGFQGENNRQINSQVDERIFRQLNQQMQIASQDNILCACVSLQNPEQKSLEKVQLPSQMNEGEIKYIIQLLENENENEEDDLQNPDVQV